MHEKGRLEEKLSAGIDRIIALAESYPDLKANENFLKLQIELVKRKTICSSPGATTMARCAITIR